MLSVLYIMKSHVQSYSLYSLSPHSSLSHIWIIIHLWIRMYEYMVDTWFNYNQSSRQTSRCIALRNPQFISSRCSSFNLAHTMHPVHIYSYINKSLPQQSVTQSMRNENTCGWLCLRQPTSTRIECGYLVPCLVIERSAAPTCEAHPLWPRLPFRRG